jgi:hypothetical protein
MGVLDPVGGDVCRFIYTNRFGYARGCKLWSLRVQARALADLPCALPHRTPNLFEDSVNVSRESRVVSVVTCRENEWTFQAVPLSVPIPI